MPIARKALQQALGPDSNRSAAGKGQDRQAKTPADTITFNCICTNKFTPSFAKISNAGLPKTFPLGALMGFINGLSIRFSAYFIGTHQLGGFLVNVVYRAGKCANFVDRSCISNWGLDA